MTPAEVVIDVFGGIRSTALAVGVAPSTVLRWCKRADGTLKPGWIPHKYMRPLLDAAARAEKRLTLDDVIWGRPSISRRAVVFHAPSDRKTQPPRPTTALGSLAQHVTR